MSSAVYAPAFDNVEVFRVRNQIHAQLFRVVDFSAEQVLLLGDNRVICTRPIERKVASIVLCHFISPDNAQYGRYYSHRSSSPVLDAVTPTGDYCSPNDLTFEQMTEEVDFLNGFIAALAQRKA